MQYPGRSLSPAMRAGMTKGESYGKARVPFSGLRLHRIIFEVKDFTHRVASIPDTANITWSPNLPRHPLPVGIACTQTQAQEKPCTSRPPSKLAQSSHVSGDLVSSPRHGELRNHFEIRVPELALQMPGDTISTGSFRVRIERQTPNQDDADRPWDRADTFNTVFPIDGQRVACDHCHSESRNSSHRGNTYLQVERVERTRPGFRIGAKPSLISSRLPCALISRFSQTWRLP